jgi:hypothetical protein
LFIQIISHRLANSSLKTSADNHRSAVFFFFKKSENNGVRAVSSVRTPVVRVRFASEGQKREAGSTQTGGGIAGALAWDTSQNQEGMHASERESNVLQAHEKGVRMERTVRTPLFFKKNQPPTTSKSILGGNRTTYS